MATGTIPFNYKVNRNLIDNWYFAGGGTGDGVFPVNQRGNQSYSSGTYCIDRWTFSGSVTVDAGGLILTSAISQFMEPSRATANQTYTLSALLDNNGTQTFWSKTGTLAENINWQLLSGTANDNGVAVRYSSGKWHVALWNNVANRKIIAVKFEKGDTQTLAHYDGGWVLNEIPNYAEELAKCQRYYVVYSDLLLFGIGPAGGKSMSCELITPVPMRNVTPTVTGTPNFIRYDGSNYTSDLGTDFSSIAVRNNYITNITATNSNMSAANRVGTVRWLNLTVSCEL